MYNQTPIKHYQIQIYKSISINKFYFIEQTLHVISSNFDAIGKSPTYSSSCISSLRFYLTVKFVECSYSEHELTVRVQHD